MTTYTLTYYNSDDRIAGVEFKTRSGAIRAGKRVAKIGGCPLMIADGTTKLYALTTSDGETEFAS